MTGLDNSINLGYLNFYVKFTFDAQIGTVCCRLL